MNIQTVGSQEDKGLEELHKQIMQFKNWLRGIHHKCSDQHLHAYLWMNMFTGSINAMAGNGFLMMLSEK